MQSFRAANHLHPDNIYCHPPPSKDYYADLQSREEDHDLNQARFAELVGELQQQSAPPAAAFPHDGAVPLSSSSGFAPKSNSLDFATNIVPYGSSLNTCIGGAAAAAGAADTTGGHQHQLLMYQQNQNHHKGGGGGGCIIINTASSSLGNNSGHDIENWGDSGTVVALDTISQHTDTSTDVDADDTTTLQYQRLHGRAPMAADCIDQSRGRIGDNKMLRRLAQNREAARKSRLRKKAYVQQLENSRIRLLQLEQELQRARQQGMFVSSEILADHGHDAGSGAIAFDMEYIRWLDEHQRLISELRSAVNTQVSDNELRVLVEVVMMHYDDVFRLKSTGAKADVFHMLSGMWKSPAERFFLWLGGFRSSELLKVLGNQLEPLTDQQLIGICNLQQSSQQAEDALSQGMEALQQYLVETLSSSALNPTGSGNVADYMGQMAVAMGKLTTLENFLHQADLLRQQTLQQLHRILTTRQAARALLVINDYVSRLRALSSLWLARPKH